MKITKRQLRKIIRESLLMTEARDPGEIVQVGDLSLVVYAVVSVGVAPFYIVYNTNKKKKVGMSLKHSEIEKYAKDPSVKWAKDPTDGKMWNTKLDLLKKHADNNQLTMLDDFTKAKEIMPDRAAEISFNTDALEWTLMGIGFAADFIPVGGTAVSTGANLASLSLAFNKKNYLGVALGIGAILSPLVGDSISILGRLIQSGKKVPLTVTEKILLALAKIGEGKIRSWLTSNAQKLGVKVSKEAANKVESALVEFRKSLESMTSKKA